MKILLINPPAENEITTQVTRFVKGESSKQPPLGLLYIASYFRSNGFSDVHVLDCQGEDMGYDMLGQAIRDAKPDVVGMGAMTFTMVDVMKTADLVKEVCPNTTVVVGGTHLEIYPRETIELDNIDYAIQGEGEIAFFNLIKLLDEGKKDYASIENLCWIDDDGKTRINETAHKPIDYNEMPFPARDLTKVDNYFSIMTGNNPITTLVTAKGCPYRCTFCYQNGTKVIYRTPESIADEMEQIKALGIREVFFVDDTFYVNIKLSMKICEELIRRNIQLPWGARARVNNISSEMLETFKRAGCQRLHIGVEAGNPEVLAGLNKKITVEQARRAFQLCNQHNMTTLAYFIIGSPRETRSGVEDTIRLAKELKPSYAQFSRMTPFPDTPLYAEGLERKILTHDYWMDFAKNPRIPVQPQFWTENFTNDELIYLADHASRKFYFQPEYILKSVLAIKSTRDFSRKFRVALNMLLPKPEEVPFRLKMS